MYKNLVEIETVVENQEFRLLCVNNSSSAQIKQACINIIKLMTALENDAAKESEEEVSEEEKINDDS